MSYIDTMDPEKVEKNLDILRGRNWQTIGSRNWLTEAGGDEKYALWLALCDQKMMRLIGLGIFDITDWAWADNYEAGTSPAEAAKEALMSDDTYAALFGGE
jgi:hypothetical protein